MRGKILLNFFSGAAAGSGGIIATETRIGSDESEIAVVKDSFREQIVASIFILLFWRQYLAFSD